MKKYFMLLLTLFMILLTTTAFIYENNVQAPQIKQPSISIDSQRFGLIKNIVWTNKYMNDKKSLIILSSKNTGQGVMSCLYHLNIDTGKSQLLAEFPSHKNLNNVVLLDGPMSQHSIVAAYDKGIIKVNYPTTDQGTVTHEMTDITGFATATSMDLKGNLVYTRENDKLLYVKNISTSNFTGFFTSNNIKDLTTYYTKPLYVSNFNSLDNIIAYTSINRNSVDLYAMVNGVPVNTLNKPVIRNVVTSRGIEDSFGFTGMNIINDTKKNKILNLFMIRRTIDKYNNDDYYSLDTIPYNTDPFGAVPAVDSTTYNSEFFLAYTSYDENHKGSLKICGLNQKPKVVVKNENIFGPISMTDLLPFNKMSYILYFTLENNNVKIKICDSNGNLVKDITDMVIKNNLT
ncbi:hypothetical protein [Candidatus Clostridium radicumherbarum]|uniref:Uncharacterized protein n=1 Tax=Candidatus Clostridium radicumherbarum TaxID=3381662 RepID=A0ABW8TNX1_9CLOT